MIGCSWRRSAPRDGTTEFASPSSTETASDAPTPRRRRRQSSAGCFSLDRRRVARLLGVPNGPEHLRRTRSCSTSSLVFSTAIFWICAVVARDEPDLAPVDAATLVDHVEISGLFSAYRCERSQRALIGTTLPIFSVSLTRRRGWMWGRPKSMPATMQRERPAAAAILFLFSSTQPRTRAVQSP